MPKWENFCTVIFEKRTLLFYWLIHHSRMNKTTSVSAENWNQNGFFGVREATSIIIGTREKIYINSIV